MIDLYRELIAAQADIGTNKVLRQFDVAPDISPICGITCVRFNGPFYEPNPDGTPAIIQPAMEGGEVADLIAYLPHQANHWRVRRGACPLLGIDNMGVWSEPLCVWQTPLNYLRNDGLAGVVVLSWPAAIPLLRSCSELVVEDVAHGAYIRDRLSTPIALPTISVPKSQVAA